MEYIRVEVAYATPKEQRILGLTVPAGTTVAQAISLSGIETLFPEIDLASQKVGIFSRPVALTQGLVEDDRVEIYRRLLAMDPKEARRQRAASVRQRK